MAHPFHPPRERLAAPERAALTFMASTFRAHDEAAKTDRPSAEDVKVLKESRRLIKQLSERLAHEVQERTLMVELFELIERGMPATATDVLALQYAVPLKTVAQWLDTSPKTLSRRRAGLLGRTESDVALRFGRVFEQARESFGTEEAAREWLTSAQPTLAGAVPVALLRTELGARQVERAIELIDYGDYV